MADEIVFNCEPAMWAMLAEEGVTGIPAKPFDMRRHDIADDRIYRLSLGHRPPKREGVAGFEDYRPNEDSITFLNTETQATLTRRYLGIEFTDWAPGWCFLLLGERVT